MLTPARNSSKRTVSMRSYRCHPASSVRMPACQLRYSFSQRALRPTASGSTTWSTTGFRSTTLVLYRCILHQPIRAYRVQIDCFVFPVQGERLQHATRYKVLVLMVRHWVIRTAACDVAESYTLLQNKTL